MRHRLSIGTLLLIFLALNYYIGLRGYQWAIAAAAPQLNPWLYWTLFVLLCAAFPLARFTGDRVPRPLADALTRIGAYWLMAYMYILPLLLLIDLVRLPATWLGWEPTRVQVAATGWTLLTLVTGAVLYGFWRARHPVIVTHQISIPKSGGRHSEVHVVIASDSHLGAINGLSRLNAMVAMINQLDPDLLLLPGDLMDDDFATFVALDMATGLKGLKSKLGTYSVMGNHEYYAGHLDGYRREMERAGIRLLIDEWVKVDDSFYVIGRDDIAGSSFGRRRKPLADVMEGVDPSLPLILMDHQPYRLEEAEQAGINLQVSGHTHRGQIFPNHLITRRIFELDWGYLKKGALHVIVSLGFGTWGPPVRIGNRPELVSVRIRFEGDPT